VTCRDFADFLMEYLDGNLSTPERQCFDNHLAECPDCVTYLATYQEAIRLGKGLCADESASVPPEVPNELVQAILAARSARITQGRNGKAQARVTRPGPGSSKDAKKSGESGR
jgi:anti-sigma factor RsiW